MNVLLFSPEVVGHPRVYCRVIADALQSEDCHVYVAMGFSDEYPLKECSDLVPLLDRSQVTVIDLRNHSANGDGHLTAPEIRDLQESLQIAVTVFIEADKSRYQFAAIANGECSYLSGRNLGIFANTSTWIPGEDHFTGEPIRLMVPSLRTTLGNIKRRLFNRKASDRYFYEELILKRKTLDEIWVKDERVTSKQAPPVYWMPEISRPANHEQEDDEEFLREKQALQDFLSANQELEPVLYFGDAAFYKGYDLFLKFVELNEGVCALHPGLSYRKDEKQKFHYDVEQLRTTLKSQGRLFETNAYVHSEQLKRLYFSSVRIYLTTHRLALSSSTVIQALEMGKPVLVPNRGLLGHRVLENGLGAVYDYENIDDLTTQANFLWNSDLSLFKESTERFWAKFSDEAVARFFKRRIMAQPGER